MAIEIPRELLPVDGRFGCGPSKIRPEQVSALAAVGSSLLGTSGVEAGRAAGCATVLQLGPASWPEIVEQLK